MAEFTVNPGQQPVSGPPPTPDFQQTDRGIHKPSDLLGFLADKLLAPEIPGTTPVSAGKKVLQAFGVFGTKLVGEGVGIFFGSANKLNNNADQRYALSQISGGVVQEAAAAVVAGTIEITKTWEADP